MKWIELLDYIVLCLVAQSCLTLCDPMDSSPPGSSVHGDSLGKNTGVGCHVLLQGIFPTQGQIQVFCIAGNSLLSEPPGKTHRLYATERSIF